MSRREYHIEHNIEDGLVFHAPLTYGDFTDHVSGVEGSPLNAPSGNLIWSEDNLAYRFYCNINYQNCLVFPVTRLRERWNNAQDFTWVIDIKSKNTTTYTFVIGYSKSGDTGIFNYGYSLNHLASYQSQISSTQFDRFSVEYDNTTSVSTYRKNGVIIGSTTNAETWLGNPSLWKEHYYDNITIGSSIGGNFTTDAYFKNAFLFNRILTPQEIIDL